MVALCLALVPRGVRADEPAEPRAIDERSRAGVAAGGVLPVGDWREDTGPAGAASVWLEVPVSPRLAITARAGAIVHAPVTIMQDARAWLLEVPVLGGARLDVARVGPVRLRLGGDVGLVVAHRRVTLAGRTDGDTGLRFGSALVAAIALDRFALEGGAWLADLTDPAHTIGAQLSLTARLGTW